MCFQLLESTYLTKPSGFKLTQPAPPPYTEVLDFPPVCGLLDAHALWHVLTPGCNLLWYIFVQADIHLAGQTAATVVKMGKKE